MTGGSVAGRWGLRAGAIMIFALLLVAGGSAAYADDETTVGVGSATPTQETDERETDETGSERPTEEPDRGEDVSGQEPDSQTPTPTPEDGRGNDAVAPGTVTVVLVTSDSNPLPDRATVCIGGVCQSASGMRSGVSFWFEDLDEGWQEITVQVGSPYGGTTATIEVRDGINGVVELILRPVEPTPAQIVRPGPVSGDSVLPTAAVGDAVQPVLRSQPAVAAGESGVVVSTLPATGVISQDASSVTPAQVLAGGAVVLLAASFISVRRAHQGR